MRFACLILIFVSSLAYAGNSGGGGRGVVCRNSHGKVESVELLDLWEAKEVFQFKVKPSSKPVVEQIAGAIEALKYSTQLAPDSQVMTGDKYYSEPEYLSAWLQQITSLFLVKSPYVVRRHGIDLTPTGDSFEMAQPSGRCQIEQLVNYIDSSMFPKILVNQDLVGKMDKTNLAALYLHEAFYVYLRGYSVMTTFDQYKEPNSIRVRRAIGYVFSGHQFPSLNALLGKKYVRCVGNQFGVDKTEFFVYQDPAGKNRIINTVTFNKRAIGFFPDLVENNFSSDGILDETGCESSADTDPKTIHGGMAYGVVGVGPVDFQDQTWVVPACENKKRIYYLAADASAGPALQEPQKLKCSLVESP
jgi:hypothetical protein